MHEVMEHTREGLERGKVSQELDINQMPTSTAKPHRGAAPGLTSVLAVKLGNLSPSSSDHRRGSFPWFNGL